MIFDITSKLRESLEVARQQHHIIRDNSMQAGLSVEQHAGLNRLSEYHRGRADGIRLALETIAKAFREVSE